MEVNPNHYKHIIGKAGVNINRIKDEMEVVINIEEKDGLNTIRIEGLLRNFPKKSKFSPSISLQDPPKASRRPNASSWT